MMESEDKGRKEEGGKRHFFDDAKNVKKVIRLLIGCCAGLFLLDGIFFLHRLFPGRIDVHKHLSFDAETHPFPAEGWFGFYGIYGFVACVLLVLIAKQLRKVLMRDEEYYDR